MDVLPSINTPDAASFLLAHLETSGLDQPTLLKYVRYIARNAPAVQANSVVTTIRKACGDDIDVQLEILQAIQQSTDASLLKEWAESLTRRVIESPDDCAWTNHPLDQPKESGNPWQLQQRRSSDGDKDSWFVTSFPAGERLTGCLRSKPFVIPKTLTFYLAGHTGEPSKKQPAKNFFRLVDADTNAVLKQSPIPRNDVAQKISWDLIQFAGKNGYFEALDADDGNTYAWIAFGRIDPPVVALPKVSPNIVAARQKSAAQIVAALRLDELRDPLTRILQNGDVEDAPRLEIAFALLAIGSSEALPALNKILVNPDSDDATFERACTSLGNARAQPANTELIEAFRCVTGRRQTQLARTLSGSTEGAEALLNAIQQAKAPPQLLFAQELRDRLAAAKILNLDQRIATLTKGLTPPAEAIEKLIDQRLKEFPTTQASAEHGLVVFTKTCAVCHQINGQGKTIGPQLDGIGNRGVARIMEDILDPNRNVDPAFRYSTIILKDNTVISGLQRREEGDSIVFADTTGKEIRVPSGKIKRRIESTSSLMPANFGEAISSRDFYDLIAFLSNKRATTQKAGG
jgi:putative heme-binding domain-containing protein